MTAMATVREQKKFLDNFGHFEQLLSSVKMQVES